MADGLREEIVDALVDQTAATCSHQDRLDMADALLTGPLADVLARLHDAEAAVERVEILLRDAERFPEGHILNRVSAANLRRALSGDAR